jgi:DNA-binding response OmpR family regulator
MPFRLLVVDDEEAIGFALKRYFERQGLEVDVTQDVDEARALVAARDYAVVMADLRLRGTCGHEGLDLIDHVRGRSPQAHCILLSAYTSEELEQAARARGARLLLRKPIGLPELWRHVQELL